jgi:hypothetical protein
LACWSFASTLGSDLGTEAQEGKLIKIIMAPMMLRDINGAIIFIIRVKSLDFLISKWFQNGRYGGRIPHRIEVSHSGGLQGIEGALSMYE